MRSYADSNGYPAHLQQLADTVWLEATGPHAITTGDVARALPQFEEDLARRTLGPRWRRMSDRQMEYLAALALHGGRATTRQMAATLGRAAHELSRVRDELINEGDVWAPQRGHLTLTVPVFAPYVIQHYDVARGEAAAPVLSLEQMRANAGQPNPPLGHSGLQPLTGPDTRDAPSP